MTPAGAGRDLDATLAWLTELVGADLGIPPERLDPDAVFVDLGVDSVAALRLAAQIGSALDGDVDRTAFYDHPSLRRLAAHLCRPAEGDAGTAAATPAAAGHGEAAAGRGAAAAVVGMACRLPGAPDLGAYWRLLREGASAVGPVPPDRWDAAAEAPALRHGGFLDSVDGFDAAFFGISPREADGIDPQQRLLLELAWEALEDAGLRPSALRGSRAGVFVGVATSDYQAARFQDAAGLDAHAPTGVLHSIAANRVSYFLDLRGPSMVVDSACSSSLLAAHLAAASLRGGEAEVALVGGVNVILAPDVGRCFAEAGVLAADGRCRPFDDDAGGYVRSEGAGMVVLKPLDRALADGDRVYAVLLGGAVNSDGRSNGLMAPSAQAQERLLRDACAAAGVQPGEVGYVEAFGSGTRVGDLVELRALGAVLGAGRAGAAPCLVGSVKGNLGHLEAASGIASLIKVALALSHGELPPTAQVRTPTREFAWEESGLRLHTRRAPWPAGARRVAGVSSFGFGGANAHLVLEAPAPLPPRAAGGHGGAELLPLSSHAPAALRALAARYGEHLSAVPGEPLEDICHTAGTRRDHQRHRLAVAGRTPAELASQLAARTVAEASPPAAPSAAPAPAAGGAAGGLVFAFPGDAALWPGAGLDLAEREPSFGAALARCDELLSARAGWSPVQELGAASGRSRLGREDVRQPVLFALQSALAVLWRAWGIEPGVVLGDGVGEVAAAHAAGALRLEDAVWVAWQRGRAAGHQDGAGVLHEALEEVRPMVARVPLLSSVTGEPLDGRRLTRRYWAQSLAAPGRLDAAAAWLAAGGHRLVLELSPDPTPAGRLAGRLRAALPDAAVLASLVRGEDGRLALLRTLGTLYESGLEVDWAALHRDGARRAPLPPYQWNRKRHWAAPAAPRGGHRGHRGHRGQAPRRIRSPLLERSHQLAYEVDLAQPQPQDAVAARWLALAAAALAGQGAGRLAEIVLEPLAAAAGAGPWLVQLTASPEAEGDGWTFELHGRPGEATGAAEAAGEWTRHAAGRAERGPARAAPRARVALRRRVAGLREEPARWGLARLWRGEGEAVAELPPPDGDPRPDGDSRPDGDPRPDGEQWARQVFELEASLRLLAMTLGLEPAWPLRVAELLPRPKPKGPLAAVHAVRRGPATGDLHGVDATGATLLELRGVQLQPAAAPTARRPGATPGATGPDAGPGPEQYLVALIARILRLDLAEVDREASLDGLGLDSVLGQELRAAVRQDLGVRLSERLLRSGLSVAELAGRLNDRLERMEQSR